LTEPVPAAGVLVRRAGLPVRWLLMRNARAGHWGFPKGHLEPGEGELSGALRETREETGLLPTLDPAFREVLRYVVPASARRPEHEKTVVYFLGSVPEEAGVVQSPEHDQVEWLELDGALGRLQHEQLRALLARADRFARQRPVRGA
jgi:tRNA nucleotidyltransferase (CCA-adding enzyme)